MECQKHCGKTQPSGGYDNICLNCGSSIISEKKNQPLKILKTLMYKYMSGDYKITRADYRNIMEAVHILEK
jgi:hypothetical protein